MNVRNQGRNLSPEQLKLLKKAERYGMTRTMLEAWELSPHEEVKRKTVGFFNKQEVCDNFTSYHSEAVMLLIEQYHHSASGALRKLNQFTRFEAKAFVRFHRDGLTTQDIKDGRDEYHFHLPSYHEVLAMMMKHERMTLQQAMAETKGLDALVYAPLSDFYQYGLRCSDLRQLCEDKKYGNSIVNACLEYGKHKDVLWMDYDGANKKLANYMSGMFKQLLKLTSNARDAWGITCGYVASITFTIADKPELVNHHLELQADYLLAYFRNGVNPTDIPAFTNTHLSAYNQLRSKYKLSAENAIAEIRAVCPDMDKESLSWWDRGFGANEIIAGRIQRKLDFLCKYYNTGVRAADLATCPFPAKAVAECLNERKLSPVDTVKLLKGLSESRAKYLLIFNRSGVSLADIEAMNIHRDPVLEEYTVFSRLTEEMKCSPTLALKIVSSLPEADVQRFVEGHRDELSEQVRLTSAEEAVVETPVARMRH